MGAVSKEHILAILAANGVASAAPFDRLVICLEAARHAVARGVAPASNLLPEGTSPYMCGLADGMAIVLLEQAEREAAGG